MRGSITLLPKTDCTGRDVHLSRDDACYVTEVSGGGWVKVEKWPWRQQLPHRMWQRSLAVSTRILIDKYLKMFQYQLVSEVSRLRWRRNQANSRWETELRLYIIIPGSSQQDDTTYTSCCPQHARYRSSTTPAVVTSIAYNMMPFWAAYSVVWSSRGGQLLPTWQKSAFSEIDAGGYRIRARVHRLLRCPTAKTGCWTRPFIDAQLITI